MDAGFEPENDFTAHIVDKWRDIPAGGWLGSKSVEYLRRTEQLRDLDFVLASLDDLDRVFEVRDGEVVEVGARRSRVRLPRTARVASPAAGSHE